MKIKQYRRRLTQVRRFRIRSISTSSFTSLKQIGFPSDEQNNRVECISGGGGKNGVKNKTLQRISNKQRNLKACKKV